MKRICLLGATGSIGTSTLDVIRAHPDELSVESLAAGSNVDALVAAVREFSPARVALADDKAAATARSALKGTCEVLSGREGVLACVQQSEATICVSAIVGSAGLEPTLAAIDRGMDVALANKETLVAGGALVMERVSERGVRLIPVDSEHHALSQCLHGVDRRAVKRLLITASGGPFRGMSESELASVTAEDSLQHPTWDMGAKITVDSATLANKALEVIEAHWLFDMPYDSMGVLVHPQSLVHGLVELMDGTLLAQMGVADMRVPIRHALAGAAFEAVDLPRLDLVEAGTLIFERPDTVAFPMLSLGLEAGRTGGLAPAVYSAANEAAVRLFLCGRIRFPDIAVAVREALDAAPQGKATDVKDILRAEREARETVNRRFGS